MRTSTRTLLTATTLLALAAPLAACGSENDDGASQPAVTDGGGATPDAATPAATDDASTDGASTDGAVGADTNSGVFPAIDLAEAEAGGTAFEVDREDDGEGGWEISVAVGADEVDVDVNLEGTEVLRTDTDDDLDEDERAALDAATITVADAIRTALAQVDGTLDDVELDEERDTVVWEVSIDDAEVYVDVATGEVVAVDRD